jgi:hypothetical protein
MKTLTVWEDEAVVFVALEVAVDLVLATVERNFDDRRL